MLYYQQWQTASHHLKPESEISNVVYCPGMLSNQSGFLSSLTVQILLKHSPWLDDIIVVVKASGTSIYLPGLFMLVKSALLTGFCGYLLSGCPSVSWHAVGLGWVWGWGGLLRSRNVLSVLWRRSFIFLLRIPEVSNAPRNLELI